jgi:hypothetical protein
MSGPRFSDRTTLIQACDSVVAACGISSYEALA